MPVTLNRLEADFLVFRRAMALGIFLGRRTLGSEALLATGKFGKVGRCEEKAAREKDILRQAMPPLLVRVCPETPL